MQMQPEGIGSWLKFREIETPEREALVVDGKRFNYRQLNQRVNQTAWAIQGLGVKHGDRVAILAYNGNEFVEVVMAAAKLGVILVLLNWRLTPVELTFMLNDSGAKTLFYDATFTATAQELKNKTGLDTIISVSGVSQISGSLNYDEMIANMPLTEPTPDAPVGLDTPHLIIYTAGTTGTPKGAIQTHGGGFWNALNDVVSMDITSDRKSVV